MTSQRRDYLASTSLTPPGQIPLVRSFDDARAFGPRTAGRLREITGAIAAAPHDGRSEAQLQERKKQVETATNLTYSIPETGAMVGLSRNGSYDAADRGEIPFIRFGRKRRVPKAVWDRKLGLIPETGR
jgi:excisionase family DNA binding protein